MSSWAPWARSRRHLPTTGRGRDDRSSRRGRGAAADLTLIGALANGLDLDRWPADPDTILASYRHVNGLPQFDLGIPAGEWNLHQRRRPSGRVTEPVVETPPPEVEDPADREAIDAVLADLRWERRPPTGADVLAVADKYQGRAIAFRQSQFVYESTSRSRYRSIRATFSTAAAARRFMLIDLRDLYRGRAGMAEDQVGPAGSRLHHRGGTHRLRAIWADGRATFPIGDKGRQQALTFSVAVTAELAEVIASYRHPDGEPLFELDPP